MRGDVRQDHAAGPDLRSFPDLHVPQDLRAGPDEDAFPHLRVPVPGLFPRPAQGHLVQHGNVVTDDGGFADDEARGVVDEDAVADPGGGMDVHAENFGDPVLKVQRKEFAFPKPKTVGYSEGFEGVETFVVQERLRQFARRLFVFDRADFQTGLRYSVQADKFYRYRRACFLVGRVRPPP